jgi:hypothetical protein
MLKKWLQCGNKNLKFNKLNIVKKYFKHKKNKILKVSK